MPHVLTYQHPTSLKPTDLPYKTPHLASHCITYHMVKMYKKNTTFVSKIIIKEQVAQPLEILIGNDAKFLGLLQVFILWAIFLFIHLFHPLLLGLDLGQVCTGLGAPLFCLSYNQVILAWVIPTQMLCDCNKALALVQKHFIFG